MKKSKGCAFKALEAAACLGEAGQHNLRATVRCVQEAIETRQAR